MINVQNRYYPIIHQGYTIYISDWSNLKTTEDAFQVIDFTSSSIVANGEKNLLQIIDVRGSYGPPEVLSKIKEVAKMTDPYAGKKAIVGATGSRKFLLLAINKLVKKNLKGFDTMEEAKEWLLKDFS